LTAKIYGIFNINNTIAAENLEGSSGIESRTLASRCYYWDKGEEALTPKDILAVDEADMIESRQMARLLGEAEHHGAKVVLIGDPQQLQAIEAGAAFRAVAEKASFVELTDIRCQVEPWQQQANFDLAQGRSAFYRILQHILLKQLKPTFPFVMNPHCLHVHGPSGVKRKRNLGVQRMQT